MDDTCRCGFGPVPAALETVSYVTGVAKPSVNFIKQTQTSPYA